MMTELLGKLMHGEDLSESDAGRMMDRIMEGELPDAVVAGLLVALKIKGETAEEIAGAARAMRDRAERIIAPAGAIDTCGTGGDHSNSFNVSTAAALLAAAAGIPVAKHGNRSITSKAGSADVLEALGIRIDIPLNAVQACLDETGFCFMFAPAMHLSMKYVMPVRKALGVQTIFNQLGPLTNPARVTRQLLGVSKPEQVDLSAAVLAHLHHDKAWVAHGDDGMDEITLKTTTTIIEIIDGQIGNRFKIDPAELGMAHAGADIPTIDNAKQSAAIIRNVFENKDTGPARDAVLLNAACAAVVAGTSDTVGAGLALMADTLTSGKAAQLLDTLSAITARL